MAIYRTCVMIYYFKSLGWNVISCGTHISNFLWTRNFSISNMADGETAILFSLRCKM